MKSTVPKIVEISSGKIEYCLVGKGSTVLISHGTLGGYDQGYAISQLFTQDKFQFLCVSRAGYLNSTPSTGLTANKQAQSYIELLDKQGLAQTAIIGTSGGAPSALQFAQNYPERCLGLVLISSISQTPNLPPFFRVVIRLQDLMMRFDTLWAFLHKYALKQLARSNGVSSKQIKTIFKDAHLKSIVEGIYEPVKTSSRRRIGMRLDDAQIKSLSPLENYTIQVPTYIGHAINDPLASVIEAAKLVPRQINFDR